MATNFGTQLVITPLM